MFVYVNVDSQMLCYPPTSNILAGCSVLYRTDYTTDKAEPVEQIIFRTLAGLYMYPAISHVGNLLLLGGWH